MRFPEFEGEWVKKKLEDIASFSKGKGISKSDIASDGFLECIRYGQLYTDYSEVIDEIVSKTNFDKSNLVLSEAGDVIIPASGETQIDIATASCVLKPDVALGGDLNIIKTDINGVFLSYYLNNTKKLDIAKLSQGISVVHLYASQLKTLKLNVPLQNEQQKIATFLTVIEERISTQIEIIEDYKLLKKGMMQKIFKQEIRFKDERGKSYPRWEEKKLGEVLDYEQPTKFIVNSTEYSDNYNTPVLTAGKSFILGFTNEKENIYKNTPVIIFDDFTMANKFVDFKFKVKSSAMKILKTKNNTVNLKFVYESMQMINYPKGDEHKRFWISEYSKIKINHPSLEEQLKIALTLSAIDNKVALETTYLEKLKAQKKYLLQNLFI